MLLLSCFPLDRHSDYTFHVYMQFDITNQNFNLTLNSSIRLKISFCCSVCHFDLKFYFCTQFVYLTWNFILIWNSFFQFNILFWPEILFILHLVILTQHFQFVSHPIRRSDIKFHFVNQIVISTINFIFTHN